MTSFLPNAARPSRPLRLLRRLIHLFEPRPTEDDCTGLCKDIAEEVAVLRHAELLAQLHDLRRNPHLARDLSLPPLGPTRHERPEDWPRGHPF